MSIQQSVPYPNAGDVMNRARSFVNDSFAQGAGRILTDTAPMSVQYLNSALEELQDRIANNGVITLTRDNVILSPITALPAPDPAVEIFISYSGFFDGTEMNQLPVLPSDCIAIEKVWERQTGAGFPFQEMYQPMEGLCSTNQGLWLVNWEYRGDSLYMNGSTQTEDLRIRYQMRQVPIDPEAASDLDNVQISILASVNALAHLVAYNYARARGAQAAQMMQADAEKHMRYITNRYIRRAQGISYNRRPYGSSGDRRTVTLPW